jgi:predicted PurR-regulated permease PerM
MEGQKVETKKIEISQKTIIFTIMAVLTLWFLYQVRTILFLFFVSFILMTAINPVIRKTSKFKIPTIAVMLVIYFGLIALLSVVIASLVPALVQQTKDITLLVPAYMRSLEVIFNT